MSAVQKIQLTPDDATLDLWRAAENGDVRELATVLPRVRDINAQNEHGVTALMRAAQFGHVKMVRALLENGANANIKRNDKFTALALAAFFGHTEIVRALMEHGADLQASTRSGTSPQMWATARTFNEVADQLEKPAPVDRPPVERPPLQRPRPQTQPIAAATSAPPAATTPTPNAVPPVGSLSTDPVVRATMKSVVIHTLKDPPEIWDLVHEEPRGFNARSAFLTRLGSFKTSLVFRLAALVVLIGAGVAGVMLLRGVQARNERSSIVNSGSAVNTGATVNTNKPAAATMTLPTNTAPQNNAPPAAADTASSLAPLPPLPATENAVSAGEQPAVYAKPNSRSRFHRGERNPALQTAETVTPQPVAAAPAKPNPEIRSDTPPKAKDASASPLSPQMIAPAKSATPKGKVIQWP